jgi:hypothetical protein
MCWSEVQFWGRCRFRGGSAFGWLVEATKAGDFGGRGSFVEGRIGWQGGVGPPQSDEKCGAREKREVSEGAAGRVRFWTSWRAPF